EGFRMFDYDTGRTWFRVLPDFMQFMGRALAVNYSAPPHVTDLNNIELGGTYYAQRSAKGSPYPNASSCVVTQYNITYSLKDHDKTALQFAVRFARSKNVRMKRRTYERGVWSQCFDEKEELNEYKEGRIQLETTAHIQNRLDTNIQF